MIGAVWIIQWNNPYTSPPEGMPRVLAEFFYPVDDPRMRGDVPDDVMAYYDRHHLRGSGYGIHWQAVAEPPKDADQEVLSRRRKQRLEQKMRAKYPLFADQFIAEEMQRKPDYYRGVTDAEIERKRASVLERERERFRVLLERRVIIYWDG